MKTKSMIYPVAAVLAVAACGQPSSGQAQSGDASDMAESEFDAPSGEYKPDPNHRYITFSYLHQGYSRPVVRWDDWDATLDWDAENPENSSVSVTINANSMSSGVEVYDGHLKGEQFFDTENYPEITFESTEVVRAGEDRGTIMGDLTIKETTLPVTLDVKFNKAAFEERGGIYKIGFSAKTSVNRSEFGMDYAVPIVTDQVDINIQTEFVMPADSDG